jgi:phosphatidylserine/phosphatidylglycerophosphate/cardiolipin synthase-like enzyme
MMKKCISIFLIVMSSFFFINDSDAEEVTLDHVNIKVFFSPDGGCLDAIIREIDNAKSEILVQAYSFTSKKIANSLVDAFKRHVKVEVILDQSNRSEKHTMASFLANKGIPVYIDSKHGTAHNKLMIIDKSTVITGSYNLIKAAESDNAENLLIIPSKGLADLYMANWEKHKKHSEVYSSRE